MNEMSSLLDELEERMMKSEESMKHDFSAIRTGKASTALVEPITIDYYGAPTKLRDVAGISTPDARMASSTAARSSSKAGSAMWQWVSNNCMNSYLIIRDFRLTHISPALARRGEGGGITAGSAPPESPAGRSFQRCRRPSGCRWCWSCPTTACPARGASCSCCGRSPRTSCSAPSR